MSDNPYVWQEWQYQEWLSIDVQTEPNWFKLSSDHSSFLITDSAPNVILDLAEFWTSGIYTFCAGWEIYKDTSTTEIYTDVTGSEIKAATAMFVSWTLYIYYITAIGVIHRINTDGTWHTTKWLLTWSNVYPIKNVQGKIYFWDKNVLQELDGSGASETLTAILTLPKNEKITGLTFFQDTFKIYTRVWDDTNPRNW
jgi:hypothetical protein